MRLLVAIIIILQGTSAFKQCRYKDLFSNDDFTIPNGCTKISLGGEKLGDKGMHLLCMALIRSFNSGGLNSLQEVHVPSTGIGLAGANALAEFMVSGGRNIRVLNLYGNEVNCSLMLAFGQM